LSKEAKFEKRKEEDAEERRSNIQMRKNRRREK